MLDGDLEERLRKVVERAPAEVLAVYVYGSRARGSARHGSDLDLGALLGGGEDVQAFVWWPDDFDRIVEVLR